MLNYNVKYIVITNTVRILLKTKGFVTRKHKIIRMHYNEVYI